jgi:hypothetical protein
VYLRAPYFIYAYLALGAYHFLQNSSIAFSLSSPFIIATSLQSRHRKRCIKNAPPIKIIIATIKLMKTIRKIPNSCSPDLHKSSITVFNLSHSSKAAVVVLRNSDAIVIVTVRTELWNERVGFDCGAMLFCSLSLTMILALDFG